MVAIGPQHRNAPNTTSAERSPTLAGFAVPSLFDKVIFSVTIVPRTEMMTGIAPIVLPFTTPSAARSARVPHGRVPVREPVRLQVTPSSWVCPAKVTLRVVPTTVP